MTTETANFETSRRGPVQAALAVTLIVPFAGGLPSAATAQVSVSATPSDGPARARASYGLERAIVNYQALAKGERRLTDLTPIEQAELAELRAMLRAARSRDSDTRETCIARETTARGGTLTRLEERVVDLICSQHGG